MRSVLLLVLFTPFFVPVLKASDWPSFLGGERSGAKSPTLPTTWDTRNNVHWKADIPGAGWSSPVIVGKRVYLTSASSDAKQFDSRKGLYIQDLQGKAPPGEHRWQVHCLDADTGKLLWSKTVFEGKLTSTIHIKNSLASETPVADDRHVWAYFGNVGLACLDTTGKVVWSRKLPAVKTQMGWGTGASLAQAEGRLLLINDNEEKSYLEALDPLTGRSLWKINRDEKSNWATPFVWKNDLRTEIVTAGKNQVRSYDLEGKQLWSLEGMSILAIPTPFTANGLLFISSGYVMDPIQKPVYAIRPGATGSITLSKNETSNKWIVWSQRQIGPYHPTPIVVGDYFYVLYDRGFLSCHDAKTGKEIYTRKRLGGASAFTASPWSYDGKLFCLSEDGETIVVEVGKEFKVLARNRLDEMALASPAVANGSLFIRTQSRLYCLKQK